MAQPFIVLHLADDNPLAGVNAAHIQLVKRWVTDTPGNDFREGVVNSVIEMTNGQRYFVKETVAQIQVLLAGV